MIIARKRVAAALPGYDLGNEIGVSPFGVVLAGRHRNLQRDVAIKVLSEATGDFAAEARILALLDHPHIVRIYEYVEADDLQLIVMEMMAGGTLTRRQADMTQQETCAVGLAVAGALSYAHAQGVLHRDIKPDNVLFDSAGILKVAEFGIAKLLGGAAENAETIAGTPMYMAPEQIEGGRLSPSTDLYALGVTLYQLLAGQPPFAHGQPIRSLWHQHLNDSPPPPPGIPDEIAAIVLRAMAKNPSDRHPDAHIFAVYLARAAAHVYGPGWLAGSGIPVRLDDDVRAAAEPEAASSGGLGSPTIRHVPPASPRLGAATDEGAADNIAGSAAAIASSAADADPTTDLRAFLPSTDSDAPAERDRLGIGRDVEMLARLVAARDTVPPLSIALLGDWGSGKSTLMLHMRRRVKRLAEISRSFDGESAYVGEVRQVEFNAWHYSDDQVWTGLVERLFHVLAEDVTSDEQLAPPEKVLEVSRRLHRERDEEQSRDERITAELEKIANSPSATGTFAGITAPQFIRKVAQAAVRELRADLKSSRAVLLAVAALVLAGSLLWRFAGPEATHAAANAAVVAGPIVAVAVAVVWPGWRAYRQVAAWARGRRDALQDARDRARRRVEELDEELVLVDAAAALAAFFVDRGGPEAYAPYRGLVGQVRDDLDQLVRQLDSAREQWSRTGGRRPLERIVLYVDDLDRCSPRRVVEVLAAVHLLLAFPLFVVVVAVDARWLLRSLRLHQHDMFSASSGALSGQEISRTDIVASPRDYLDKIFQIPFAVRPMGERARQYLSDLLPEVDDNSAASSEQPDAGPFESSTRDEPVISDSGSADTAPGEHSSEGPVASDESARGPAAVSPPADDRLVPAPAPVVDLDSDVAADDDAVLPSLRISHAEKEFLPLLYRFVSTPRAGKKFVNLYRLLRIGVALQGLPEFVGTPAEGGPHQAAGTLLAVLVGRHEQAPALFRAIAAGPPQLDVIEFLRSDASASDQAPETAADDTTWKMLTDLREEVATTLAEIHERIPVVRPLAAYQRWCPEIERFSFALPGTTRDPAIGT